MKKINISLMALLGTAMLVASCSNETEQLASPAGTKQVTFNATQETTGVTSRTAFSDDGKHINWVDGNKVAIWDDKGTAASDFTVTVDPTDSTKASLTGTVADEATKFIAVYPNSAATGATYTIDSKSIDKVTILTNQTATANTFDPAAAVMTAYAQSSTPKEINATLEFKNVCAFLKLTTSKAYKSITVATAQNKISGAFKVTDATAGTLGTAASDANTSVVLKNGSGNVAAGTYYICVAPFTVTTGETFTVTGTVSDAVLYASASEYNTAKGTNLTDEGFAALSNEEKTKIAAVKDVYTKTTGASLYLTRNNVYNLGTLGYGVDITDVTIYTGMYDNNTTLTFANVKNETEFTATEDDADDSTPTDNIVAFYKSSSETSQTTTVGSTGTLYVKAIAAGTATVTIGGATATITVENPTVTLSKTTINSGESITITHTTNADKNGGTPEVEKYDGSTYTAATAGTDYTIKNHEDGTYTFTGKTPGKYKVTINGVEKEIIVNAQGGTQPLEYGTFNW